MGFNQPRIVGSGKSKDSAEATALKAQIEAALQRHDGAVRKHYPYNFVGFAKGLENVAPDPAESRYSGSIHCTLETLTPLALIGSIYYPHIYNFKLERPGKKFEKSDLRLPVPRRLDGEIFIAGSTIKGMLRSVTEAAANGCMRVLEQENIEKVDPIVFQSKIPSSVKPCQDAKKPCITCRIFGMTDDEKTPGAEKPGNRLRGRVAISDAIPLNKELVPAERGALLAGPKAYCERFYLIGDKTGAIDNSKVWRYTDGNSQIRGRKFYWSVEKDETSPELNVSKANNPKRAKMITQFHTIAGDEKFKFSVEFTNLTKVELGLLLYSIALEDGMCHKLGYAKPVGCGTVKITIDSFVCADRDIAKKRYEAFRPRGEGRPNDPEANKILTDSLDAFKTALQSANAGCLFVDIPNIADLRAIMAFPNPSVVKTGYPKVDWFSDNKDKPLPTTQEEMNPAARKLDYD